MNQEPADKKRGLDDDFINDLRHGLLRPLLDMVKTDNTLMLAIRNNYINIYYRGGSILRLTRKGASQYEAKYDWKYAGTREEINTLLTDDKTINFLMEELPPGDILDDGPKVRKWLCSFPQLKQTMDFWLTKSGKVEREFQQLVVRENNFSSQSNQYNGPQKLDRVLRCTHPVKRRGAKDGRE